MSSFQFYSWNQFKVIPLAGLYTTACTLRTGKVPNFSVNPSDARHNADKTVSDGLSGRGLMTSSGHANRSFNKITGNCVDQ